jgi:hypothetical protein
MAKTVNSRAENLVVVCYRIPMELRRLVALEAAQRNIGKGALVELAIRRLLKLQSKRKAA